MAEIGQRTQLPAEAVTFYHDCFFDVKSRLDNPDLILGVVISSTSHTAHAHSDVEVVLKICAYLCQALALEQLMRKLALIPIRRFQSEWVQASAKNMLLFDLESMPVTGSGSPIKEKTRKRLIKALRDSTRPGIVLD